MAAPRTCRGQHGQDHAEQDGLDGAHPDDAQGGQQAQAQRLLVEEPEPLKRGQILGLTAELYRQQAARLALDDPDRLRKHRVQIEMLDKLRRIYSAAEHMAIAVLPRSVLVGERSV